jgi:beta-lactamase class D
MNRFKLFIITIPAVFSLIQCKTGTEIVDYSKLFDTYNVTGCFTLYDLKNRSKIVYNPEKCDSGYLPASTFKIPHALIALETGVAEDENYTIPWDGKERRVKSWNRDHTLKSAIQNSAVWYFEEIAKLIGKSTLSEWLNRINYGNKDVSGNDPFWLRGNLRITPNEQLEFMIKFYNEQLPISKKNVSIVKDAILIEEDNNYKLYGKTGWAQTDKNTGWLTGYLEVEKNIYLFVTNVESNLDNKKFSQSRLEISKSILAKYSGLTFSEN